MTVILRNLVLAGLAGLVAASAAAQVVRPGDEERMAVYDEFRRLFAAEKYADAVPLAEQIVRMTESSELWRGELPTAYNNLGAVQLRAGKPEAAQASFERALELLEAQVGIASRRLIAPLAGLGAAHAALGHHAVAADLRLRALAVSRRANGLFNIDQLDLLESLIQSYEILDDHAGVERERAYALQVVQQEYGFDDPRTIPALIKLAELHERREHHDLARAHWQHVSEVASVEGGGRNLANVLGLLGVGRNHRLQFVRDPESLRESPTIIDPRTGHVLPFDVVPERVPIKLDRDGESALLQALELLEQTSNPPAQLLATALTELGDWYLTARKPNEAMSYYRRAWPLFEETAGQGQPNPLVTPRPLTYRPPEAAVRSRDRTDVEVEPRPMELSMTVTENGETQDVAAIAEDDFRAAQFRRSLLRARFSPRFEDGEPVATDGYRFTAVWYDVVTEAAQEPAPEPEIDGDEPRPQGT